eukprot:2330971-Rhodomonas_salina.1
MQQCIFVLIGGWWYKTCAGRTGKEYESEECGPGRRGRLCTETQDGAPLLLLLLLSVSVSVPVPVS